MAGVQLSKVLADFDQVVARMRERGVSAWTGSPVGDIILGHEPPPRQAKVKLDPNAAKREYYSELLNRPVSDEEAKHLP